MDLKGFLHNVDFVGKANKPKQLLITVLVDPALDEADLSNLAGKLTSMGLSSIGGKKVEIAANLSVTEG